MDEQAESLNRLADLEELWDADALRQGMRAALQDLEERLEAMTAKEWNAYRFHPISELHPMLDIVSTERRRLLDLLVKAEQEVKVLEAGGRGSSKMARRLRAEMKQNHPRWVRAGARESALKMLIEYRMEAGNEGPHVVPPLYADRDCAPPSLPPRAHFPVRSRKRRDDFFRLYDYLEGRKAADEGWVSYEDVYQAAARRSPERVGGIREEASRLRRAMHRIKEDLAEAGEDTPDAYTPDGFATNAERLCAWIQRQGGKYGPS